MLRLNLIIAGVAAGVATGLAAWFAAGGASANADKLTPLVEKFARARAPVLRDGPPPIRDLADLTSTPIFPLSVGPGATHDSVLRVDGVSITPRHAAVLVSVDGNPAEWMAPGESRGGVTVQEVTRSGAVIETIFGPRRVELGEAPTAPPPNQAAEIPTPASARPAMAAPVTTIPNDVPKGFRAPPPPASARR